MLSVLPSIRIIAYLISDCIGGVRDDVPSSTFIWIKKHEGSKNGHLNDEKNS